MSRRVGSAAGRLALAAPRAAGRDRPPDVLLVVIDTLRADRLSAYGHDVPTSPRLDALAAGGVLFERCTAQSSWTVTSMISLLTGLPVFADVHRIPETIGTLPEAFAAAGHRTAAFVANSALPPDAGFARGIETWDARPVGGRAWPDLRLRRARPRLESRVSNLDVMPTLLGLAGLPVPAGPGRDLSAVLLSDAPVPDAREVVAAYEDIAALITPDGRKVVVHGQSGRAVLGERPVAFDLVGDPGERSFRPVDRAARALLDRLEALRAVDPFAPWADVERDPEMLERLRELGYVR